MTMSLVALSVRMCWFQVTVSLTLMLPSLPLPAVLWMVTLPWPRFADRVAPLMSPPVAAMVKPSGSISQVPSWPDAARVVIAAPSATFRCAPEVSMCPPSPPFGALASSVPPP